MANVRIKDLTTDSALAAGDYVVVDSASEGSRKFDLGTELSSLKEDIGDLSDLETEDKSNLVAAINEAAQGGGGGGGSVSPYTSNPAALGTASPGSVNKYSRGDHVHPLPTASAIGALPSSTTAADIGGIEEPPTATEGQILTYGANGWEAANPQKVDPAEITVSDTGALSPQLDSGKIYHFTGALTSLTVTLKAATGLAEYHFDFLSGSTAPTLTLPNTVVMPDSFQVEANKRYEIDILNGYGVAQSWAVSSS